MAVPLDDAALVRAAQSGDRGALDQLFRRHYDRVFGVCRRITGNEADAADDGRDMREVADLTAGDRVEQLGDREQLDAALAALPEDFRVPVVLRDVADLDYAEIAAILDVPIGTVKSRIARGRGILAGTISRANGNHRDTSERPTAAYDETQ